MEKERTKYANSILVSKEPLDATEIIRLRLSQAKLINKEFYLLFREISDLKRNYAQQLRKVVSRNENLEKLLNQDMLESKVLTADELQNLQFDSLGPLKGLWSSVFSALKLELQSNTELYHTIDHDVVTSLKDFTEKDPRWNQSRNMHSALCKTAVDIERYGKESEESNQDRLREANDEWDSQAADLFELFEATDYNRLLCLKNCLLTYQSSLGDCLGQNTRANEQVIQQIIDFEPESEIDRFARDASNHKFQFRAPLSASDATLPRTPETKSPQSAKNGHGGLGGLANRLSSSGTVIKHELVKSGTSDSSNSHSLKQKKSSGKLKSKMGSIFGRHKLKQKKADRLQEHPISESETSSLRTADSGRHANETGVRSSSLNKSVKRETSRPEIDEASTPPMPVKPSFAATSSTLSINQPPLKPQSREKLAAADQKATDVVQTNNTNETTKTSPPIHVQAPRAPQAPVPPPSRKTQTGLPSATFREPHGSVPTNAAPNRRDVQSRLFTDLSQADIDAQSRRHSSLSSQMTGELKALHPQSTGSSSSLPMSTGQSIFHHSELTSSGLSASLAEVINATFNAGVLTSSQQIGEIALNYVSNGEELPIDINLKIKGIDSFEKVTINQAFIEQVKPETYKINPHFIESKTLGAFKYSLANPIAPIVIHPAWRFEDHQASVVLTIKKAPNLDNILDELQLDDLVVSVYIEGASATSALSKPQGSFSKEKKRITWRFEQPLTIKGDGEERLIARFMTDGKAHESPNGIGAKFTIKGYQLGSSLTLESQEVDINDPFGANAEWKPVTTKRTLVAGKYTGLS